MFLVTLQPPELERVSTIRPNKNLEFKSTMFNSRRKWYSVHQGLWWVEGSGWGWGHGSVRFCQLLPHQTGKKSFLSARLCSRLLCHTEAGKGLPQTASLTLEGQYYIHAAAFIHGTEPSPRTWHNDSVVIQCARISALKGSDVFHQSESTL